MLKLSSLFFAFVSALAISAAAEPAQQVFNLKGMHCEDCAQKIQSKVCVLPGVLECAVEVGKITMTTATPITPETVQAAIGKDSKYKIVSDAEAASMANEPKKAHKHHKKHQ